MYSLRTQIMVLVIGMILVTTVTIMFFVQRETKRAIFTGQDENARNLLNTVVLNVENEYKSIVFHRQALLERRKSELKNVITLAMNDITYFYDLNQKGEIGTDEAKAEAMTAVKDLRYDDGVGYFWINDMGEPIPRMIMHPTIPGLDGKILNDPSFNCALGIKKNLFQAFVEACKMDKEGYVDYLWPKPTAGGLTKEQPKISFVREFIPWGWVIGTGVYVDDIEEDSRKRLSAVLEELKVTFSKVRIAESGYMYVFNGNQEMMIHPSLQGENFKKLKNPVTGNPILVDLMSASHSTKRYIDYLWEKPPDHKGDFRFLKRSYVTYFEPLDWYIASSVYFDEQEKPAKDLGKKIIVVAVFFVSISLVLSLLLSMNITRPLQKLMHSARDIELHGVEYAVIPVSGTIETRELGEILDMMIRSIRNAVKEEESLNRELAEKNLDLKEVNEQLMIEVNERQKAETVITAALHEKEVLLREIHHRVKNNMAVVISLLNLQANNVPDERVRTALEESRNRVRSMALIHESLYRADNLTEIYLQDYASSLVRTLVYTIEGRSDRIKTVVNTGGVLLSVDQAVYCGLILNELVTNSLKYAFKSTDTGTIDIFARITDENEVEMIVKDNGIGIPPSVEPGSNKTLGMRLVSLLVENQLGGHLQVVNDQGTQCVMRWPLEV